MDEINLGEEYLIEPEFTTLCVHTYPRAISLRRVLESHGIVTKFEKLIIRDSKIVGGIKVMIRETDIPHALKITESMEMPDLLSYERIIKGVNGTLLIPIDYNVAHLQACKTGFEIAQRLSLQPVLLHSYAIPFFNSPFTSDNLFIGEDAQSLEMDLTETKVGKSLEVESKLKMSELQNTIEKAQKTGEIPNISFSTVVNEGVAEDVIKEYCRLTPPELIVMPTRCKQKKNEELLGSVTAELLDTCKLPIFSIPENGKLGNLREIKKLVYLCMLDQHDLLTIDAMMRMFEYPEVDITLIPIADKDQKKVRNKIESLAEYFTKTYKEARFSIQMFSLKTFMEEFNDYEKRAGIEMLLVSNKRRNIFTRILNPGIAHKLLLDRDIPMLAFPYS